MNSRTRKFFTTALVTALVLSLAAVAAQAATNKSSMKSGASYIAKESKKSLREFPGVGFRADAVSALNAARKSGSGLKTSADDTLMASLRESAADYAITAGGAGKLLLAVVAAGSNPQCFGNDDPGKIDLYALVNSFYIADGKRKGQYGDSAFDQALAMLAVKASDHKIPSSAVKFVKNHRGSNGWNFALSSSKGDDVESTALIIEALRAAGVSKNDKALKSAFNWIYDQRNNFGGFNPLDPQGITQANTTAYAIRAGDAMGKNLKKSKNALRALQKKQGWFRSNESEDGEFVGIATSDAVIALSGRHYPVAVRSKPGASCA